MEDEMQSLGRNMICKDPVNTKISPYEDVKLTVSESLGYQDSCTLEDEKCSRYRDMIQVSNNFSGFSLEMLGSQSRSFKADQSFA